MHGAGVYSYSDGGREEGKWKEGSVMAASPSNICQWRQAGEEVQGGEASWPQHCLLCQWRQAGEDVQGGEASWPQHLLLCQWRQGGAGVERGGASWPQHLLLSQ